MQHSTPKCLECVNKNKHLKGLLRYDFLSQVSPSHRAPGDACFHIAMSYHLHHTHTRRGGVRVRTLNASIEGACEGVHTLKSSG